MSRSIWLLLLVVPLLVGCGAGLKETGRLPILNPLGIDFGGQRSAQIDMPLQANGGQATGSWTNTGRFTDNATEVTVSNVRGFVLYQPILSAKIGQPGDSLPASITVESVQITIRVTDPETGQSVQLELDQPQNLLLTRAASSPNKYRVSDGAGLRATYEATGPDDVAKLKRLVEIVTKGGENEVNANINISLKVAVGQSADLNGRTLTLEVSQGTGTLLF
jgi:hypothetical protein